MGMDMLYTVARELAKRVVRETATSWWNRW
ncbi:Uncharacterised protein [Ewingella americana]|uniref:Uncharacterized protein n=1 Tax=Ewingella americana TaxID=41202 RepID=A0A377TF55_9GAMM|nr:Uncharacterised protein [Ewingella americana]